jgi:hypothetical protein
MPSRTRSPPSGYGAAEATPAPAPAPTIIYDGERTITPGSPGSSGFPRRTSLLAPPDVPSLLRAKRKWWRRDFSLPSPPRSLRLALMVLSIAASAVQANGVYCWPT